MARWLGRLLAIAALLLVAGLLLIALLPGEWLARRVAVVAGEQLGASVTISSVDVRPFSLTPLVDVSGMTIEDGQASSSLHLSSLQVSVALSDLLRGDRLIDRLQVSGAEVLLDTLPDAETGLLPVVRNLSSESSLVRRVVSHLSGLPVRDILIDRMMLLDGRDKGTQNLSLQINGATSTAVSGSETLLQVEGVFHEQPLLLTVEIPGLYYLMNGFPEQADAEPVNVNVELGDSRLLLEGLVEEPADLQDVSLHYSLTIDSGEDWQLIDPSTKGRWPPLAASGDVMRGQGDWLLRELEWQWGQSDLSGEVRIDTASTPPAVDARLNSNELHSEELGGLLPLQYAADEYMPGTVSDTVSLYVRLLQYLDSEDGHFQGSLSYRADRVVADAWPVTMIDVLAEKRAQQLVLAINRIDLGSGLLEGEIDVRFGELSIESSMNLYLKRFEFLADEQAGTQPGRLAAYLDLRLLSQPAGNELSLQDGQLLALASGGDVSQVLVHLMGEEVPPNLLGDGDQAKSRPADCSFTELQFGTDKVDIATLVSSRDERIVLGDGSLSWADRSMDVSMESHARKSADAARVDAWHMSGPWSAPARESVSPVLSRDTAAAVVADIVSPAARLMPFLDSGGDAPYSASCSGMANALQGVQ